MHGDTIYLLSGGRDRSDWVRNAIASPHVTVELGDEVRTGTARLVTPDTDEDRLARRLLVEKYRSSEDDLASWGRTSLPVADRPRDLSRARRRQPASKPIENSRSRSCFE